MKDFPYVQQYRRRGKLYYYFRRKGVRIRLRGEPGSPEFQAAFAAALSGEKRPKSAGPAPTKGTFAGLVAAYYASPEFINLRASTKRTYRTVLDSLREAHGDKRVARLERHHIKAEMAKLADRPAAANKFFRFMHMLLEHAVELEWIPSNPARGIKKLRVPGDGFQEWPEALIEQYEAHWPLGTKQRLAFDLLLYTGQRRQTIPTMARSNLRGGEIRVTQEKTGARLWLPIHPSLQASIGATATTGLFFIETEYGKPFTTAGFGNWFRKKCDAAGIHAGYAAHGLRKAAGRRLAEAGCTAHEIMSVLGHKSLSEAERYTRGADQRKNARAAMEKVSSGTEQDQNLSSQSPRVSSKGAS